MNIVYIATSKIPSRTANSIHVMKMCHEFANEGHNVTLIYPNMKGIESNIKDVYSFYGVKSNFKLRIG